MSRVNHQGISRGTKKRVLGAGGLAAGPLICSIAHPIMGGIGRHKGTTTFQPGTMDAVLGEMNSLVDDHDEFVKSLAPRVDVL